MPEPQSDITPTLPAQKTEMPVVVPEELKPYETTIDPEYLPLVIERYNESQRLAREILKTVSSENINSVEGYMRLLRTTADQVATSPFITTPTPEKKRTDRLDEDVSFVVLKELIKQKLSATRDLQHNEWALVNEALGPLKNNAPEIIGPNKEYRKARTHTQERCAQAIDEQSGLPGRAKRLQEIVEDVLREVLITHERMRNTKNDEKRETILPPAKYANDSYTNTIIKIANASIVGDEWPGVLGVPRVWKEIEKSGPAYDQLEDMTAVIAALKSKEDADAQRIDPRSIVIG